MLNLYIGVVVSHSWSGRITVSSIYGVHETEEDAYRDFVRRARAYGDFPQVPRNAIQLIEFDPPLLSHEGQ